MAHDPSAEMLSDLIEEVLVRLARDPDAAHLWHWRARPACADTPAGPARRGHLKTLLGLLGVGAISSVAAGCKSIAGYDTARVSDAPRPIDAATPFDGESLRDGAPSREAPFCGDDPCAAGDGGERDAAPAMESGVPDGNGDASDGRGPTDALPPDATSDSGSPERRGIDGLSPVLDGIFQPDSVTKPKHDTLRCADLPAD